MLAIATPTKIDTPSIMLITVRHSPPSASRDEGIISFPAALCDTCGCKRRKA